MSRINYEERFRTALRRIVAYQTPAQLRRNCEHTYGLSFEESIEMAYENIQGEARAALAGYRKPKSTSGASQP